jgi:hypothetical protein
MTVALGTAMGSPQTQSLYQAQRHLQLQQHQQGAVPMVWLHAAMA